MTLLVEIGVASELEQDVQAAMNFTPIGESGKQKLREKIAPSRSAWVEFRERMRIRWQLESEATLRQELCGWWRQKGCGRQSIAATLR